MVDYLDPLIRRYAETSLTKPTYVQLRRSVRYITVIDCSRECFIYADDSQNKLIVHLTPGSSGSFEFPVPTQTLVIVWVGVALEYQSEDVVLFSYLSVNKVDWSLASGDGRTLYRQWLQFGAPPPSLLTVGYPMGSGFQSSLGFMVDPNTIPSQNEVTAHALTAAINDALSREQILAVGLYLGAGTTATVWDGSVSVQDAIANHYIATTGQQSTVFAATTAQQLLSIYNPVASGKIIRVWGIDFYVSSSTAATDLSVQVLRTNSVPSGGSTETRVPLDTNNPASIASVITGPTVAVAGSSFGRARYSLGITGAAPTTNPPPVTPWTNLFHDLPNAWKASGMVRREGEGFSVQVTPTNASTVVWASRVYWSEE